MRLQCCFKLVCVISRQGKIYDYISQPWIDGILINLQGEVYLKYFTVKCNNSFCRFMEEIVVRIPVHAAALQKRLQETRKSMVEIYNIRKESWRNGFNFDCQLLSWISKDRSLPFEPSFLKGWKTTALFIMALL